VLGAVGRDALVREVARLAPDLVVCHEAAPDDACSTPSSASPSPEPRPVVVFTQDPDAARSSAPSARASTAYVVNGYAPERLRSVIQVARARFAAEARLRGDFADLSRRFDERKLVDRAKGILMRAREVTEAEAFEVLRTASMHSNRRVGQVSRQVIAAAHYADAVNRAGKLRMLSQRLVKLYALRLLEPGAPRHAEQLAEAAARIEAALADLDRSLSRPTFGDLLQAVSDAWKPLEEGVAAPPTPGRVAELDAWPTPAAPGRPAHRPARDRRPRHHPARDQSLRRHGCCAAHSKLRACSALLLPADGGRRPAEPERLQAGRESRQAMRAQGLRSAPRRSAALPRRRRGTMGRRVVRAARPARQGRRRRRPRRGEPRRCSRPSRSSPTATNAACSVDGLRGLRPRIRSTRRPRDQPPFLDHRHGEQRFEADLGGGGADAARAPSRRCR
jgi:AmiR/NasT family two-component response regulator